MPPVDVSIPQSKRNFHPQFHESSVAHFGGQQWEGKSLLITFQSVWITKSAKSTLDPPTMGSQSLILYFKPILSSVQQVDQVFSLPLKLERYFNGPLL